MPVDFVIVRASSVPELIKDEESELKAGITGSDILWEEKLGKNYGEEMPMNLLNPQAKQSSLYVGVTKKLCKMIEEDQGRCVDVTDLSGSKIATKYQRIAEEYFQEKCVNNVRLYYISGKDEAMQYTFRNCNAILGIEGSGDTRRENSIEILEKFHEVTVRMIEAGNKLTRKDNEILNDLREKSAIAVQKKREI